MNKTQELISYLEKNYSYTRYVVDPKEFLKFLIPFEVDFEVIKTTIDLDELEWSKWEVGAMGLGEGIDVIEAYIDSEGNELLFCMNKIKSIITVYSLTEAELFEVASDMYNLHSFVYEKNGTKYNVCPDFWNGGVKVFKGYETIIENCIIFNDKELEYELSTF